MKVALVGWDCHLVQGWKILSFEHASPMYVLACVYMWVARENWGQQSLFLGTSNFTVQPDASFSVSLNEPSESRVLC